jgi:NAD(P)-dependent dehydrogenase (short-subunit alcohol dehydrogenase family)
MKPAQTVLITGAQGAVGSALVNRFLEAGFTVYGTVHQRAESKGKARPLRSRDRLHWLRVDLSDSQWVKSAFGEFLQGRESLGIWIHAAGGFRFSPVDQVSDAELDELLQMNLKSAFYVAREILPLMKQKNQGRILFFSSRVTSGPGFGMAPYAASKAGINILTQTLAQELKDTAIQVNALLPTVIDTPQNRKDMPGQDPAQWVPLESLVETAFQLTTAPWAQAIQGALIPISGRL